MRNARLIALCVLLISCGTSETETGKGGSGGNSGGGGSGGSGGRSGSSGGGAGTSGGAGTTGGAGTSGNAGNSGNAGTSGTAGTGGSGGASAGTGGSAAGSAGAGGRGGAGGAAGNGGGGGAVGGRGGASGNGGASGGRGGATGGSGGRGGGAGSVGSGGSAGSAGASGQGGGGTAGTGGRGGAAGSVDAGSDGGGAFNPCPSSGACIIMPLGDSITDGVGSSGGGYRVPLFSTTVTNTETITFVGRNVNGPTTVAGRTFPRNHEGYSGYTIDPGGGRSGISPLVDGAISMFHPNIVLLMIGTNDVNISLDLANAPTRLGALLDRITTDAPSALVVVAQLTPTTNDTTNGRVRTYNNAIPGLVQTRAAAGKHIVLVDMYSAFTANTNYKTALMNDELHPNDAGYVVMASTWYAAIRDYVR